MSSALAAKLRGIVTVLNTPFTATGEVDHASLAGHVRYALGAGVRGFLVPALASEVGALTGEERLAVVETVLGECGDRAIVVGGASGTSTAETCRNIENLQKAGCPAVLAGVPFVDTRRFTRDVTELCAAAGNLLLQEWDPVGGGAPPELILDLWARHKALIGVKVEVVGSGPKYTELLERSGGELFVAGGWAVTQMIEGLDRGVHAFMPTGLHELYTRIYADHHEGRRDEAVGLFYRLQPVLAFSNQSLPVSIRFFKLLLYRQGVYATADVRDAGPAFDRFQTRVAEELCLYARDLMALPHAPAAFSS